jgi:iron complex outermembrane receptor protein
MTVHRQYSSISQRGWIAVIAWAVLGLLPAAASAQNGQVVGQVLGPQGEVIPFVALQYEGESGWHAARADGQYVLSVPPGTHTILAQALGYRTARQTVTVQAGATVTIDFTLETRPLDVAGVQVTVLRPDLTPTVQLEERQVREANPKDVGELLRNLEGVDAVRRGPLGLDPVVRGLRETEVGTYLDGTRLEPAGPARMDSPLTHLDPSAVRNVEVIKGPYALTWGAGNLSAIRVETQALPETESRPRGQIGGGYDTNLKAWETTFNARGRQDMISYTVDGSIRQGDDYKAGESGADGAALDVPADYESWEARGKLGIDVGESGLLTLSGGYQKQGPIDYPGRLLTAESFESPNFSGKFNWEGEGTVSGLEIMAYNNHVDHTMSNRGKPTELDMAMRTPPCALDIGVDSKINVLGGRAAANLDLGGPWSAEVGGDLMDTNPNATRNIAKSSSAALDCGNMLDNPGAAIVTHMWPDATIRDIGGFARLAWAQGGVSLSGTLRLDQVAADANADSVSTYFTTNNPSGSNLDASETNVSAAVTSSFDLDANWVLSLGVGSAVRTADASERYSDRIPATKAQFAAEFMGDPQLDPERSTQGDAWVDGRYENFLLHFGTFYRKVKDYITIVERTDLTNQLPLSVPPKVFQYINGDATFYGVDASATVGVTDEITTTVTGSYLRGQDDTLDEPAIGVAPLKGTLALRYEDPDGRFYTEAMGTAVGKQDRVAVSRNEGATPGYQTVDLRAGVGLSNGLTFRGGVLNVFDKYYYDHLNARNPFALPDRLPVPEPGRVFFLDVAMAF